MVRLAWALTGSEVVAEDVVHDAFIRVHAHWSRIESPRAYLRQTVVNACRSASRRARRDSTHAIVQFSITIPDHGEIPRDRVGYAVLVDGAGRWPCARNATCCRSTASARSECPPAPATASG
jgi:DNA-directed RNA polymerase specialized sigma24 family protein